MKKTSFTHAKWLSWISIKFFLIACVISLSLDANAQCTGASIHELNISSPTTTDCNGDVVVLDDCSVTITASNADAVRGANDGAFQVLSAPAGSVFTPAGGFFITLGSNTKVASFCPDMPGTYTIEFDPNIGCPGGVAICTDACDDSAAEMVSISFTTVAAPDPDVTVSAVPVCSGDDVTLMFHDNNGTTNLQAEITAINITGGPFTACDVAATDPVLTGLAVGDMVCLDNMNTIVSLTNTNDQCANVEIEYTFKGCAASGLCAGVADIVNTFDFDVQPTPRMFLFDNVCNLSPQNDGTNVDMECGSYEFEACANTFVGFVGGTPTTTCGGLTTRYEVTSLISNNLNGLTIANGADAPAIGGILAGTLSTTDGMTEGTATIEFTPYIDVNASGTRDAGDCEGDVLELEVTIKPAPNMAVDFPSTDATGTCPTDDGSLLPGNNLAGGTLFTDANDAAHVCEGTAVNLPFTTKEDNVILCATISSQGANITGTSGIGTVIFSGGENYATAGAQTFTPGHTPELDDAATCREEIVYTITPYFLLDNDCVATGTLCEAGFLGNGEYCEGTPFDVSVFVYPSPEIDLQNAATDDATEIHVCSGTGFDGLVEIVQAPTDIDENCHLSILDFEYDIEISVDCGAITEIPVTIMLDDVVLAPGTTIADGIELLNVTGLAPAAALTSLTNASTSCARIKVDITPNLRINACGASDPADEQCGPGETETIFIYVEPDMADAADDIEAEATAELCSPGADVIIDVTAGHDVCPNSVMQITWTVNAPACVTGATDSPAGVFTDVATAGAACGDASDYTVSAADIMQTLTSTCTDCETITYTITPYTFFDANGNGILDAGDNRCAGTPYDVDVNVIPVVTDFDICSLENPGGCDVTDECGNDNDGLTLTVAGSQSGVTYSLYYNSAGTDAAPGALPVLNANNAVAPIAPDFGDYMPTGITMDGDVNNLQFPNVKGAGCYIIFATWDCDAIPSCRTQMNISAQICLELNNSPTVNNVTIKDCAMSCDNPKIGMFTLEDAENTGCDVDNDTADGESTTTTSYHISYTDAQNGVGALISPYQGVDGTVLFARVQETASPMCYSIATVTLDVLPCPTGTPNTYTFCKEDLDGTQTIDGNPTAGAAGTLMNHVWTGDVAILSAINIQMPVVAATTAPGTYTLTYQVDEQHTTCDASGTTDCTSEAVTITVVVNPSPDGTITPAATICNGDCIDLIFTATAGTGPFDVTVDNAIGTVNGLMSGDIIANVCPTATTIYSITAIKDANGCDNATTPVNSTTITVEDLPVVFNTTLNNCPVTPDELVGTFDLSIADSAPEATGAGNSADIYTAATAVTITYHTSGSDAQAGINALVSTTVTDGDGTVYYARVQNTSAPNCFAVAEITLNVYDSPVATAGNYEYCEEDLPQTIANPTPTGGNNTSYTHSWAGPDATILTATNVEDAEVKDGTAPGTYFLTYTATDANSCASETVDVHVTINAEPDGYLLASPSYTCAAGETVDIYFVGTAGEGPYTVVTNPANPAATQTVASSGIVFNDVTPTAAAAVNTPQTTTYTVTSITDAQGCNAVTPFGSVAVVAIDLDPTFTLTSPICGSTGVTQTLALTTPGTLTGAQVVWYGGLGAGTGAGQVNDTGTGGVFTAAGASAGIYTICVDVIYQNCSETYCQDIEVVEPVNAMISNISVCDDTNDQIDLTEMFTNGTTTTGGTFSFNGAAPTGASINGNILTYATTGDINVTYSVGSTPPGGSCVASMNATVTVVNVAVEITAANTTNANCAGTANGKAMVTEVALTNTGVGTFPGDYSFLWSDGQTTQEASGLTAGGYIVIVTDAEGCTGEAAVTITDPLALEGNISAQQNITCTEDGSATVTISGGTGPYMYNWSDGTTNDIATTAALTSTASDLPLGLHTVTVTDLSGTACDIIVSVNITDESVTPYQVFFDIPEQCTYRAIDLREHLTVVDATNAIATPAGTFSIVGTALGSIAADGFTYTPAGNGFETIRYTIADTDADGADCTVVEEETIEVRAPITATATCACADAMPTTARTVNVTGIGGGLAPYTLTVTGGNTVVYDAVADATSASFTMNENEVSYQVIITDARGCEKYVVGECQINTLEIENVQNAVCETDPVFTIMENIAVGDCALSGDLNYSSISNLDKNNPNVQCSESFSAYRGPTFAVEMPIIEDVACCALGTITSFSLDLDVIGFEAPSCSGTLWADIYYDSDLSDALNPLTLIGFTSLGNGNGDYNGSIDVSGFSPADLCASTPQDGFVAVLNVFGDAGANCAAAGICEFSAAPDASGNDWTVGTATLTVNADVTFPANGAGEYTVEELVPDFTFTPPTFTTTAAPAAMWNDLGNGNLEINPAGAVDGGTFKVTYCKGAGINGGTGYPEMGCVRCVEEVFTIYPSYDACFDLPMNVCVDGADITLAADDNLGTDFATNNFFGQTEAQVSNWSVVNANGVSVDLPLVGDNSGDAIFNPDATGFGPGTYTITHTIGVGGCQTECVATIVVEPQVFANLNDLHIECVLNPSGNVSLDALFITDGSIAGGNNTTAGGVFTAGAGFPATGAAIAGNTLNYTAPGCYPITYTVTSVDGATAGSNCFATATAFVLISEQPQPSFDIQNEVCLSAGDAAQTFTPNVSSPTYTGTTTELWTIADNVTGATATIVSTTGVVSLTPDAPGVAISGTYTITLKETISFAACGTTAAGSCEESFDVIVNVQDGTTLDASFMATPNPVCAGDVVTLTPATTGGVFTGTGVTDNGNGTGATFTSATGGDFTVSYILNSANGCSNSFTSIITVNDDITIAQNFEVPTTACASGSNIDLTTYLLANDECQEGFAITASTSGGGADQLQYEIVNGAGTVLFTSPVLGIPFIVVNDVKQFIAPDLADTYTINVLQGGAGETISVADRCTGAALTAIAADVVFTTGPLVATEICKAQLEITWQTDLWPNEVFFNLVDGSGTIVNTYGPGLGVNNTVDAVSEILTFTADIADPTAGPFSLQVFDGFGDGTGTFTVTDVCTGANLLGPVNANDMPGTAVGAFVEELGIAQGQFTGAITGAGTSLNSLGAGVWYADLNCNGLTGTDAIVGSDIDITQLEQSCFVNGLYELDVCYSLGDEQDDIASSLDNCNQRVCFTITIGDIDATINVTNTTCPGASNNADDGALTVNPTGGTAPYTFRWSTNETTAAITGLTAGGYTVTVFDSNGCSNVFAAEVSETPDTAVPTVVSCPTALTPNVDAGQCGAVVTYAAPVFSDNCDGATLAGTMIAGYASGATFPVGATTVTWTYMDVADQGTATCTFTVTVTDNENPVANCVPAFNLDLDADGNANITVADINNNSTDNCGIATMTIDETEFDCTDLGANTVTLTVTDNNTVGLTHTCTTIVTIENEEQAAIATCPADMIVNTDTDLCTAVVIYVTPTFNDGCGSAYNGTLTAGLASGSAYALGTTLVTHTYTDTDGYVVTCNFNVTVEDNQAPEFTCPDPQTVTSCNGVIPDLVALVTDAADACGIATTVQTPIAGTDPGDLNGNVITAVVTVTDNNGNDTSCDVIVTVDDGSDPIFTNCPTTMVMVANDVDECSGKVNWSIPVAMDDCFTISVTQTGGPASGTLVPVGAAQTITYTATDSDGNTATCMFDVMVIDSQDPIYDADIVMPADATVECSDVPTAFVLTNADVMDNCTAPEDLVIVFTEVSTQGADNTVCGPDGFYNYTITRTWTITDEANNVTTHVQVLTVQDTIAPMAMCVGSAQIQLDESGEATLVATTLNDGSTDNCAVESALTFTIISGGSGVTPDMFNCLDAINSPVMVELEVADPCGNTDTCMVAVTVLEGVNPCNPEYDYEGSDPCVCLDNSTNLDNGQFSEFIQIRGVVGETWTLTANAGLFATTSPAPPAAPTPIAAGTTMTNGTADGIDNDMDGMVDEADENIFYSFAAIHVDGQGYEATFANTLGIDFDFSNTCFYPTPEFANLPSEICLGTSLTLELADAFGGEGTAQFFVDGQPLANNVFNGSDFGIGSYTITATFDAGDAANFAIIDGILAVDPDPNTPPVFVDSEAAAQADPGCTTTIETTIDVVTTPTQIACNDLIQVSLSEECVAEITPDMVLEGTYDCDDDYDVIISYPFGTTGYTPPNQVDVSHIGITLTYTLSHSISGNVCWGEITVEDKLAPILDCPDDIILACTADMENLTVTGSPMIIECSDFELDYYDVVQDNGACAEPFTMEIARTFIAIDEYGNVDSCSQIIQVQRPDLADVVFPENVAWSCEQVNQFSQITGQSAMLFTGLAPHADFTDIHDATGIALTNLQLPNTGSGIPTIDGFPIMGAGSCMLAVNVDDELYDICGASYEILRTWKVRDMCIPLGPNNPREFTQIIKVLDEVGPNIVTVGDITVSANITGQHPVPCTADFVIPAATITDACSEVVSIETIHPFGTNEANGGQLDGLGIGAYTITYVAEDACGNTSNVSFTVNVVDDVAPTPICDQLTDVSLGSNGTAVVPAAEFDDGSYDNCCLSGFTIARMNGSTPPADNAFGAAVTFTCADIPNNNIMVVLRVTDCYDNTNDCMVEVEVEDKLPPYKVADVADTAIDCDVYFNNIETALDLAVANGESNPQILIDLYGEPTYGDNCDVSVSYQYSVNVNSCGEGDITRTWNATDMGGNVGPTCTQTITINHVNNWQIQFPQDVTLECEVGMNPNAGDDLFGEPTVFFDDCELIAIAQEDEVFNIVPDACYKIIRTYTAINWCVYDGDDEAVSNTNTTADTTPADNTFVSPRRFQDGTNGIIVYQQIIKVLDEIAPEVTCPVIADFNVNANCVATVDLPFLVDTIDCSPNVVVTISTPGIGPNGTTGIDYGPFQNVEPGTYTSTYTATDNCGNSNSCQVTFNVVDNKAPTPYCVGGLVVELMGIDNDNDGNFDEGMVDIWASDFDAGSFDNCPGDVTLTVWLNQDNYAASQTLGFSNGNPLDGALPISCDSPFDWQQGNNSVYLYVTDANGNTDFCITTLTIESNPNVPDCDDNETIDPIVAGTIETENGQNVELVDMSANGDAMVTTGADGEFLFSLTANGDYTIVPEKDINHDNGVTTFDLVLINQHILSTALLDTPYKMIAADANNSASITAYDLVVIRRLILQVDEAFTNNTSWRFVAADYEFPNPSNPWQEEFAETASFNNLQSDQTANFIGVKIGDVNGSANANSLTNNTEERSTGSLIIRTNDLQMEAGETYEVAFTASDLAILGYQFTMNFDAAALAFVEVKGALANEDNFGFTRLQEGALTASWNEANAVELTGNELFSLVFKARQNVTLSEAISLNSRYTAAEAYNQDAEIVEVALAFNNAAAALNFELYEAQPNPFVDATVLSFELPTATTAKVTITDAAGKTVKVIKGEYAKGYNEVIVRDLNTTGMLYFQLETPTDTATGKMIKTN